MPNFKSLPKSCRSGALFFFFDWTIVKRTKVKRKYKENAPYTYRQNIIKTRVAFVGLGRLEGPWTVRLKSKKHTHTHTHTHTHKSSHEHAHAYKGNFLL